MGSSAPIQHLPDLIGGGWRDLSFRPFRDGVEICEITTDYPKLALLRYAPGASVPYHRHTGLETIMVLDGAQSDETARYPKGSLIVNPEGSAHSVWSDEGCVVLIQWQSPVEFIEKETT